MESSEPGTASRAAATSRRRAARPRWILVRQGEGPARKWVWQLAAHPGEDPPPAADSARQ